MSLSCLFSNAFDFFMGSAPFHFFEFEKSFSQENRRFHTHTLAFCFNKERVLPVAPNSLPLNLVASRVEAWQSVPLMSLDLPRRGLFFSFFQPMSKRTSARLFVNKNDLAVAVALLFIIGNHRSSHAERRRGSSVQSALRQSVRRFWNTQTQERVLQNRKWRERRVRSLSESDSALHTSTKGESADNASPKTKRVTVRKIFVSLTNRLPAAWSSPVSSQKKRRKKRNHKLSLEALERPSAPLSYSYRSRKLTTHWLSAQFFLQLISNSVGQVPLFSAITGRAGFTLGLSIAQLTAITFQGIVRQGVSFPRLFLPRGPKWPIAPLFILLESISFAFRAVSQGTRLYCNMFAGHLLLHQFTALSLVPVVCLPLLIGAPVSVFAALILMAQSAQETIVAVLQSGVFCQQTSFYQLEVQSKKETQSVARVLFVYFPPCNAFFEQLTKEKESMQKKAIKKTNKKNLQLQKT